MHAWFFEQPIDDSKLVTLIQLTPWVKGRVAANKQKSTAVASLKNGQEGSNRIRCVKSVASGALRHTVDFFEDPKPEPVVKEVPVEETLVETVTPVKEPVVLEEPKVVAPEPEKKAKAKPKAKAKAKTKAKAVVEPTEDQFPPDGEQSAFEKNGNKVWSDGQFVWVKWSDQTFFKEYTSINAATRVRRKLAGSYVAMERRPDDMLNTFDQLPA